MCDGKMRVKRPWVRRRSIKRIISCHNIGQLQVTTMRKVTQLFFLTFWWYIYKRVKSKVKSISSLWNLLPSVKSDDALYKQHRRIFPENRWTGKVRIEQESYTAPPAFGEGKERLKCTTDTTAVHAVLTLVQIYRTVSSLYGWTCWMTTNVCLDYLDYIKKTSLSILYKHKILYIAYM